MTRRLRQRPAGVQVIVVLAAIAIALLVGRDRAAQGSVRAPTLAPTPGTPVYGGIPGALPPGFAYVYGDHRTGWPVREVTVQHPIRGSFLDPRGPDDDALGGYHFGIDINVDDLRPDRGAPRGLSHRVFAIERGVVTEPVNDPELRCGNRRLDIGHFAYWHVSPIVRVGQHVRAGQQIGWTCLGYWHVHISEWQLFRGVRVWVNPLHRHGLLLPYTDTLPPVVDALEFVTPPAQPWQPTKSLKPPDTSRPLSPRRLYGLVELRASIGDPQSFLGFLSRNSAWPTEFHPYRVAVEITSVATRQTIMNRVSFQADQLPQQPYLVHYAPGTVEDENMSECVGPPQQPACAGKYWFRPFSRFRQEFWNTRRVPNGRYRITVRAWDVAGNVGSKSIVATVAN